MATVGADCRFRCRAAEGVLFASIRSAAGRLSCRQALQVHWHGSAWMEAHWVLGVLLCS